jgi:hypothetical protein
MPMAKGVLPGGLNAESLRLEGGSHIMPTKHRVGTAAINFNLMGIPKRLNRRGIKEAFEERLNAIRYGGLVPQQRWLRRFDDDVTDLSTLPNGLFEAKALILPRKHLPRSKDALHSLCRKLIDRGENEVYIEIVLRGWPVGWSMERHVAELWAVRDRHRGFAEDVIRGRHGRALRRLAILVSKGELAEETGLGLIIRQGLLWCAMDVQMVTCGARASMIRPFGGLVSSTMSAFKAGTGLRLMHSALAVLEMICAQYQTAEEEERDGPNGAKPKGSIARWIRRAVEKQWPARGRTLEEIRADLDDGIVYIRGRLSQMKARMSFYENYVADPDRTDSAEGADGAGNNKLRHFHTIWYSGLSPATGMAVALTRFAMAERHLVDLVNFACGNVNECGRCDIDPLLPFPADSAAQRQFQERVLDLAHAARLVHLRDDDCLSRTRKRTPIQVFVRSDPDVLIRDPLDRSGLTFVNRAFEFLAAMRQRPRDAHVRRPGRDPGIWTYWKMDCVPEIRLAL